MLSREKNALLSDSVFPAHMPRAAGDITNRIDVRQELVQAVEGWATCVNLACGVAASDGIETVWGG